MYRVNQSNSNAGPGSSGTSAPQMSTLHHHPHGGNHQLGTPTQQQITSAILNQLEVTGNMVGQLQPSVTARNNQIDNVMLVPGVTIKSEPISGGGQHGNDIAASSSTTVTNGHVIYAPNKRTRLDG